MQISRSLSGLGGLRKPLLCALVLLCTLGIQASGNRGATIAEVLCVATYNLENYTLTGRMTADGYRKDYPKPEEAKRALHRVIQAMNADILVFQEMGGLGYLEELRRDLSALGCDYPHMTVLDGPDKERRLAALSRVPFLRIVPHDKVGFPYLEGRGVSKRGLLELSFATAAGELTLWVLHLKSRFSEGEADPGSALLRNAEATALRDIVLSRHKDPSSELYLILGDFNDTKKSRPLRAFQARGKNILSIPLDAADSRSEVWTHHYRQQDSYDRVDHILCSPGLRHRIQIPRTSKSPAAMIVDIPETAQASDHRPVLVRLDLRSALPGCLAGVETGGP